MNNEIQKFEQPEIPAENESSRMLAMIERMATDPNVDPEKLGKILAVKQIWEADEARKLFARDMAVFQSKCPIIERLDSANGRNFARIDRIHRETRALRQECGFWFVWQICEEKSGAIQVEGILGHRSGHTVPVRQLIPLPDEIRGTNQAQRAGSAQSYAKRYGELAALNIITGEDDDGGTRRQQSAPKPATNESASLKKELWTLTQSLHGGDKNKLRQYCVDDLGFDPEKPIEDATDSELRTLIQLAKKKL